MDSKPVSDLNSEVRKHWENRSCGTWEEIVGDAPEKSLEWFQRVENHRYSVEPCIHAVAQFTRHHGKKILEIGVGAGTDHLQWARAGAICHGVDLTDAAIANARAHLGHYGFESDLRRIDAESLPFPDASFDLVYSWGVIHHSEKPERIIAEIRRVLKPKGMFVGMLYRRRSLVTLRSWIKHALLRGRPWRSFRDVLWNHMESLGTKAYTEAEIVKMFSSFEDFQSLPYLTVYDTEKLPQVLSRFFPDTWGWFIGIRAWKH
ncbi:MAG: class I SAM-dependent methyltransferase [Fibrobacteres bacterium]|nr:class I SAM-dependent methyltransferase [Fibrobacterota bacterium]